MRQTFWKRVAKMTGLDTGFFVELLRGEPAAVEFWERLIDGSEEGTVSCLTLLEIERLGKKRAIEGAEVLLEAIPAVCRLVWIQDSELLSSAAGLSHDLGIPAVDALILAGFIQEKADVIYTTDSHLEAYSKKGIKIINLRKK